MSSGASGIQAQIRAAELRLIEREAELRRRFGDLHARARQAVQAQLVVLPLLGTAVAAGALWWLLRGRRGAQAHRASEGKPNTRSPPRATWQATQLAASGARHGPIVSALLLNVAVPLLHRLITRPKFVDRR